MQVAAWGMSTSISRPALGNLGFEVEVFDSLDRNGNLWFAELNRDLPAKALPDRPDIVLFVLMHYEVWTETFDILKLELNITDDFWKYRQFLRYLAPHFDIHATTSHGAVVASRRDRLRNVMQTQWLRALPAPRLAEFACAARSAARRVL